MKYRKNALLTVLGLDVSAPGEYIDDRATPNCQNIEISRSVLSKRAGTTVVGATLGEEVMYIAELLVDSTIYIVRVGLTTVELLNESAGTWSDITGDTLTATTSDPISIAFPLSSGERVLVFSNFVDPIQLYTGTGTCSDLTTSPPLAKFLTNYGAYLITAHVETGGNKYRMRVQWCDAGDITSWTASNYTDLLEDGNDITGLCVYGNYICVHKESAIYLGYGVSSSETFRFERKNTGVGTSCNNTIQSLNIGEQIFLARDGIHVFNGISAPLIESPINDELRSSMNPQYIHKCWSVIVPELDEYWVGVPIGSQTSPDTVYKFNYKTRQCYKDYRPNIRAAGSYQRTSNLTWASDTGTWAEATDRWDDVSLLSLHKTIMFGDSAGLTLRRDTATNNDNSVVVDAYWESKDFEAETKGVIARWDKIEVWAKGNTVKVEYSIDSGTTWNTISTMTLTSDYPADTAPQFGYFDVISSKIRFKFSNAVLGETFTLKQFIISYTSREYR